MRHGVIINTHKNIIALENTQLTTCYEANSRHKTPRVSRKITNTKIAYPALQIDDIIETDKLLQFFRSELLQIFVMLYSSPRDLAASCCHSGI